MPDHEVPKALIDELGEPMMSATLRVAGEPLPVTDVEDITAAIHAQVSVIIDAGNCGIEPTTVVDLTGSYPEVLRDGKGPSDLFR